MRTLLPFLLASCLNTILPAAETKSATNPPPSASEISLENFKLVGDLAGDQAAFTFTALARVDHAKGGSLELLSGTVALTEISAHKDWKVLAESNRFILEFSRNGKFPVRLKFNAAVRQSGNWKTVDFRIAGAAVQPIVLEGLPAETQFEFAGAARPERKADQFVSYLPADGAVKLSWKEARPETEGKLFYAAEMLSQITVSPGLMRQQALTQFKVMQGELNRVTLMLRGEGEVTRVQGDQVLAWNVEPMNGSKDRRLIVQLNQAQKDQFAISVQLETPLGAFPQTVEAMQLRPEGATRFAGYLRIVNEGAVRLEVAQASGLSQVSPEQFPETEATRATFRVSGSQKFAYRFSGPETALRIRADQILPELAVSQVLAYRLGESELAIDAEIEVDVREAPLRELLIRIPKGYALARLNASGSTDYFLSDPEEGTEADLRLVYGQPVTGRQVVQLRLERNKALGEPTWTLPRIEVPKAKSVRGHVGAAADAGFRLAPERTVALTEIATAFFPRKVPGLQAAFRLSETTWQATLRVERLPQTVQADGLHLFSIGEGVAYGSSVINYLISGAPVSVFKVELSSEYFNVEFTGKDIRNWQKTEGGYLVYLHTPITGPYTMLASYERPFAAQGDTLGFTGARPLDAQSEQGHTLITSAYQFQVKPQDVSPGLLPLEPAEVPAEYRLFFDAPILAAYRYSSRPFNLKLALSPLTQGDSLSQVVDRAVLRTGISKEGQVLTDVRYFVKNRGLTHFRMTLPRGTDLWSATVNGAAVVPVMDGADNLVPLPQRADPNAVLAIDLKLASRSASARQVKVSAPMVDAPVMLTEWKLEPDAQQRLLYREGTLTPIGGVPDVSGFAGLTRTFTGSDGSRARSVLLLTFLLIALALLLWRWALRQSNGGISARRLLGTMLGLLTFILALVTLNRLRELAGLQNLDLPVSVGFLAPIQQRGAMLQAEVANIADRLTFFGYVGYAWPALIAVVLWLYGWWSQSRFVTALARVLGWTLLAWAALRAPNGAGSVFVLLMVFLVWQAAIPAVRQLWPRSRTTQPAAAGGTAPAVTAFVIGGLVLGTTGCASLPSSTQTNVATNTPPVAESVLQEIRVEDKFAVATARIHWEAQKGQILPLLFAPGVVKRVQYPTNDIKLVQGTDGSKRLHQLVAAKSGAYDVTLQYELQLAKAGAESGFSLPVPFGLINRVNLEVANLDVDVFSPQAVAVEREATGSNTVAKLVLAPAADAWIGWKPRSRNVKSEKPIFYAEFSQLYVPAAGVIEGAHYVSIRPAQGQLGELIFDVPPGLTVTDVLDPSRTENKEGKPAVSLVSLWRFDPDARKLRVTLSQSQSRPFGLLIRSQIPTGPLPFEQSFGLIRVNGAAGQIGLLGIATGNEVQLDNVGAEKFSPINLEDFPVQVAAVMQGQVSGLAVRRAFRYADSAATGSLKASPVEPDVRVETQDTLSLGEDRTVLAANATVEISRAGIFRLSFAIPPGFEVEAITGSALSHWTEFKSETERIVTLHLPGKTEGKQQFTLTLAGPGTRASASWAAPRIVFREASKQRGTLVLVPEQGMRLQVAGSEGVTQLDPQKSGIRQKGVLAFRILQSPWNLALAIERVDPWIQVNSLQHALVNEAQVKVTANLQYQIENTGLKSFRVYVPTNAESVRFQGDQVADYLKVAGSETNGLQLWEIKLHRRVIGSYLLQATYQVVMPEQRTETVLRGVRATDVNLQRGFVTVQSAGRLQVRVDAAPEALQNTEWQSIPRALKQDLQNAAANFAYRLVEPAFELPLKLDRHEAAKLLPARVNSIHLTSVIADDGMMLTQVRMEILPGDKRLLHLTLPAKAEFWFAYVNQNGVWPWREQDQWLIPLEQQSRSGRPAVVEFFYSSRTGASGQRKLDLQLFAPKFDLPLEQISWSVSLNEKWEVKDWSGNLQLQREEILPQSAAVDLQQYLQKETSSQQERTKQAEELMAAGNSALEQGDPKQARRAFQAAYGLTTHDAAFNEDARVQLHNLKLQQALVGLNARQAAAVGESASLGGKLRELQTRLEPSYTQQDAKEILAGNSADDNSAYMRLAERLVQQQDAAVSSPAAIRANLPDQGRLLTFQRAVVVDRWADLRIGLEAKAVRAASSGTRLLVLAALLAFFILCSFVARAFSTSVRHAV